MDPNETQVAEPKRDRKEKSRITGPKRKDEDRNVDLIRGNPKIGEKNEA